MDAESLEVRRIARGWTREGEAGGQRELGMAVDTFRWLYRSAGTPQARAAARADLSVALQLTFERTGSLAAMNEAIELVTVAIGEASEGPQRARQESNLANALRLRFEAAGKRADLEKALRHARRGLDAGAATVIQAQRESNLALLLRIRYELLDREPDIEEAIIIFRSALRLAGTAEPQRSRIASNLAIALRLLGAARRDIGLLREAVELAHEAGSAPDGLVIDQPGFLVNAALASFELSELTGADEGLQLAVVLLHRAAETAEPGHDNHRIALINLAFAERARAARRPVVDAKLDAAVDASLAAVGVLGADDPDATLCWSGLGRAYWMRFERSGAASDSRAAVNARLQAAARRSALPNSAPRRDEWPETGACQSAILSGRLRPTGLRLIAFASSSGRGFTGWSASNDSPYSLVSRRTLLEHRWPHNGLGRHCAVRSTAARSCGTIHCTGAMWSNWWQSARDWVSDWSRYVLNWTRSSPCGRPMWQAEHALKRITSCERSFGSLSARVDESVAGGSGAARRRHAAASS
ncbi:hypothetical protein ACIBL3_41025 [Kribbella sp. NPDC050124]|uniref:hypothetical protein n=1 Tax=Kribbella sp. NPDC050124 TaxID=3364114 RepID=UPI0037AFB223